MKLIYSIVTVIMISVLAGCAYTSQGVVVSKDRYAEALQEDHFGDFAEKIVYLDQNWDRWDSLWFYNTTQGSNFLPYDIFVNLEQKDSERLFRDSANMSKYRYLPQRDSWDNPDGLPVGFVKDSYQDREYVGFTCAACHTTQVNYKGTGIRIDGGPAMADMEGMLLAIEAALLATLNDENKFQRMATRISNDHDAVRKTLANATEQLVLYNKINRPINGDHTVHYGYGRLDAFGRIYNRVLSHLTPGDVNNFNHPNAPVSYPVLWDTPQHDFVQWNGVANNNDGSLAGFLGPLGRNTGEVLGVFATFSLEKQKKHLGYESSVDKRNLTRLEKHLVALESPLWPDEILPEIDRKLAQQGETVFEAYKCQLCHSDDKEFIRNNPKRLVIAQFASVDIIGTDIQMASNAIEYKGRSGLFEGEPVSTDSKDEFAAETPVVVALTKAAQGVIIARDPDKSWLRARAEWLYDIVTSLFDNPVKEATTRYVDFEVNTKFPSSLNAYKARPLNGIWAAAPYMHNGAIPSLYEMLLPSCSDAEIAAGNQCRPNRFTIANRELDTQKVGFVQRDLSEFPALFEFDTSLPGNGNVGHEYAVGKTPVIKVDADGVAIRNPDGSFAMETLPPINNEQRWALVEYLKTL